MVSTFGVNNTIGFSKVLLMGKPPSVFRLLLQLIMVALTLLGYRTQVLMFQRPQKWELI